MMNIRNIGKAKKKMKIEKVNPFWVVMFFLMFGAVSAFSAVSKCASPIQVNGLKVDATTGVADLEHSDLSKLWECPSLLNVEADENGTYPFRHSLSHVDYVSGVYKCDYRYAKSGQYKHSCAFTSQLYLEMKKENNLLLEGGLTKNGEVEVGLFQKRDDISFNSPLFNRFNMIFPPSFFDANKRFNEIRKKIYDIEDENSTSSLEESSKFDKIGAYLDSLQDIVNRHLIDPYLHPENEANARKGYTFSNFLAGLITLDPAIIAGYDPNSGEIIIQNEWKVQASRITVEEADEADEEGIFSKFIKFVKKTFTSIFSGTEETTPNEATNLTQSEKALSLKVYTNVQYKIYSYAKIFEEKLWGFYYLLQERFDIGYDFIMTTLLITMTLWLTITVGLQEGIKHLMSRESGGSSTNNEAYFLKVMLVLVTLGMFVLSVPSGNTSPVSEGSKFQSNSMRHNYTIAKIIIRKTASLGADMATMFADLGLSAFSQYVVKREVMLSIGEIRKQLENSAKDIYMYSSALDLKEECSSYFNISSDSDFLSSIDSSKFPINELWKESEYAKNKNISSLSYDACKTAYKLMALMPYQLAESSIMAEEQLKKSSTVLSEATYLLTYNNIALEEKLGWVSAFAIPLEYFILKKNDMFLSQEIDREGIREEAKNYMSTLSKDRDDLKELGVGGIMQDTISHSVSKLISSVNYYYLYNILPMFSQTQQGILKYFEKIYEDRLKIYLAQRKLENEAKKRNSMRNKKDSGRMDKVKDMLKSMTSKVGKLAMKSNFIGSTLGYINMIMKSVILDVVSWHTLLMVLSYIIAISIWKMMFAVIFTILISLLFLVSFLMYFYDLLVHFTTSLFMFVWSFTKTNMGHGEGKLKEWMKNTLVIVLMKPSILVFGGYMFIFLYELMLTVYQFVFTSVTSNLLATISLMNAANSRTGIFDSISATSTVLSMQSIAEIVLDLFGLYLAYITIIKIPKTVGTKLGVESDDSANNHSITEMLSDKQNKDTNPLG